MGVRAVHGAIQTLMGVLIDRVVVMIDANGPVMSAHTATGLLQAITCCADLPELLFLLAGQMGALARLPDIADQASQTVL